MPFDRTLRLIHDTRSDSVIFLFFAVGCSSSPGRYYAQFSLIYKDIGRFAYFGMAFVRVALVPVGDGNRLFAT